MLDDNSGLHHQQQLEQQQLEMLELIGQYACPYCGKHAPEYFFCCSENHVYQLDESNIEEFIQ